MKFFKPEDFPDIQIGHMRGTENIAGQRLADVANAKLEREAKVVELNQSWSHGMVLGKKEFGDSKYKALLINIEPIEACTHPSEKVGKSLRIEGAFQPGYSINLNDFLFCECGARVKVKRDGYEVAEEIPRGKPYRYKMDEDES